MAELPSDNQIRNLLDGLQPSHFAEDYAWLHGQLKQGGVLAQFVDHAQTYLIGLDGLTFFSSKKVHCAECATRGEGYYHSAVTPVLVKPDLAHVLPLLPEFIVPQDGSEKQDCERNAANRWLVKQSFAPHSVTFLADDLYACQPICQQMADLGQYFVCVAKPESHATLYAIVAEIEALG